MKVNDILTELRHAKPVPRESWHRSKEDATNFYKPGFRERGKKGHGDILGTIGDWLNEMGATKQDIAPAREAVLKSPEYQRLIKAGFEDISTEGEKKAGTVSLLLKRGSKPRDVLRRKVHANGNIRTHAGDDTFHAGRGTTLHPMTIKTHPKLSGQQRIEGSMKQSLQRLYDMYRKQLFALSLDRLEKA